MQVKLSVVAAVGVLVEAVVPLESFVLKVAGLAPHPAILNVKSWFPGVSLVTETMVSLPPVDLLQDPLTVAGDVLKPLRLTVKVTVVVLKTHAVATAPLKL